MRSFRITLFFQDPMSGIFDYHVKESGVNTKSYYQNIQKCMNECAKKIGKYQLLFSFYEKLAAVLADKADLGMCIKSAYDRSDRAALKDISQNVIPGIICNLTDMKSSREKIWMNDAKPFGYEILDIKIGGVITRLKSTGYRIDNYLNGNVLRLEELEEERLPYFTKGIKNVNSNENGAAALSLRLFCYARFMAVKNPYAETHDWVYENELTSAQANQYVFRLLDGSTEKPSMDMLIRKLKSVRLVRDSEMNGRKIYVIKFTDIEMEELMNKSIIDKPSEKLLKEKKSSVKKEREEVVNSSWKDIFLKNSKGENLQMLRYWFYIQYNAEKNGKKYVSRSLALSESAIEYVYRGIPKRMEVLQDLFAQMKQMKLVKEDVVKNEIVVRPAKLEGLEIKNYIKDKPVDLMSFNYTNV